MRPRGSAPRGGVVIRLLEAPDLDRLEDLSAQVGFNQTRADWSRLLELDPTGCFAAVVDGRIVATTTTTGYAPCLAWVGMVIVDEAARRLGIGSRLVEHALHHLESGRGVGTVALDATPQGRGVYARQGFADQYGIDRLEGAAVRVDPAQVATARPMTESDLPELVRADAVALGAPRGELMAGLMRAESAAGWLVEDRGSPIAWAFRRPGARRWHIGPVLARDPESAEAAVLAAMEAIPGEPVVIDALQGPRRDHLVDRFGLATARSFVRMVRGGPLPAPERTALFATTAPELG